VTSGGPEVGHSSYRGGFLSHDFSELWTLSRVPILTNRVAFVEIDRLRVPRNRKSSDSLPPTIILLALNPAVSLCARLLPLGPTAGPVAHAHQCARTFAPTASFLVLGNGVGPARRAGQHYRACGRQTASAIPGCLPATSTHGTPHGSVPWDFVVPGPPVELAEELSANSGVGGRPGTRSVNRNSLTADALGQTASPHSRSAVQSTASRGVDPPPHRSGQTASRPKS